MYTKCHMHNTTAAAVTARDLACGKHWYSRPKKKLVWFALCCFCSTPTGWKDMKSFMTEGIAAFTILKEQYLTWESLLLNDKEITL